MFTFSSALLELLKEQGSVTFASLEIVQHQLMKKTVR